MTFKELQKILTSIAPADREQPGHFGPRVFALEGRMIYHRKGEDEE